MRPYASFGLSALFGMILQLAICFLMYVSRLGSLMIFVPPLWMVLFYELYGRIEVEGLKMRTAAFFLSGRQCRSMR